MGESESHVAAILLAFLAAPVAAAVVEELLLPMKTMKGRMCVHERELERMAMVDGESEEEDGGDGMGKSS
jgi:hypothetical protein